MPELSANDFITNFPDGSVVKAALQSYGTNADAMQPTDELFFFLESYGSTQAMFNAGTDAETINVLGDATITTPRMDSQGNYYREISRTARVRQNLDIGGIDAVYE